MGAGASAQMDAAEMESFKLKLLKLEDLSKEEKLKLLADINKAVRKMFPVDEQNAAAQKLQSLQRKKQAPKAAAAGNMGSGGSLAGVFAAFCATYRQEMMTNTVWAKFCKDAKLLDAMFTKPDIDMVWSKAAGKAKKVGFAVFEKLLEGVAHKKGVDSASVQAHVLENAKVSSSGTKGESRFYDDKDTWTGAATKGGPTNDDKVADLANMTSRA